jgi:hypothetical protein
MFILIFLLEAGRVELPSLNTLTTDTTCVVPDLIFSLYSPRNEAIISLHRH